MPWLRLDDGWNTHPKILVLTRAERLGWVDVLTTCARHRTGGHFGRDVISRAGIRASSLPKFTTTLPGEHGPLWHQLEDGSYLVHNWAIYNSDDVYERVRCAMRFRHGITSNDLYRLVGGKREIVLKAHAHYTANPHEITNPVVPGNHPPAVPGNHLSGSPRAQAPSRPVPYLGTTASNEAAAPSAAAAEPPTDDRDPEQREQLDALAAAGWTPAQLARLAADVELERAHGLLVEARADASVRRPGALAWQRFEQGAHAGSGAAAPSVAAGAQGERSRSARLLPFGPCAVDGCDHRAASQEALDEHRRNVHGEGEPERVGPPAQLLALLGGSARPALAGEPDVELDDDDEAPVVAQGGEAA